MKFNPEKALAYAAARVYEERAIAKELLASGHIETGLQYQQRTAHSITHQCAARDAVGVSDPDTCHLGTCILLWAGYSDSDDHRHGQCLVV